MSKAKSNSDRNKTFYNQGYKDAITTGWFRWRRHPNINAYRNGFNHGIKNSEQ